MLPGRVWEVLDTCWMLLMDRILPGLSGEVLDTSWTITYMVYIVERRMIPWMFAGYNKCCLQLWMSGMRSGRFGFGRYLRTILGR
jgi:hypothetical protein